MMDLNNSQPHPKNIMVVDDDDSIREAMRAALEYEGYNVSAAENGQVALDLIKQGYQPCVIVLDLMMPVMDGWTFADHLAADKKLAEIPIVVISAFGDQAQEIRAKEIYKKPVNLKVLFNTIKQWCSHEDLVRG